MYPCLCFTHLVLLVHYYKYPDVPVIVTLPLTEILIKVCPRSRTGRVYTLIQKEIKTAVDKFEIRTL